MKKRYVQGLTAGSLALCLLMTACGASGTDSVVTTEEQSASSAAEEAAAETVEKTGDSGDTDKEETVYATAAADGTVKEVKVDVKLENPGGNDPLTDVTDLTDIKNKEGDESFDLSSDGILTWENHGEDIQYEGTSSETLPVNVKVTYYLDGVEMQPEEMAGKSGRVKIRFDYENETARSVKVGSKKEEMIVPMAAVTAVFLPEDTFSDVEVDNGKLISMDDQNIVLGYALPGLADCLQLENYKLTEDVDLPEYVEITAYAEDFELDFTATVVTPGIFSDIKKKDLKDLDDFIEDMADLTDASGDLADAADELSDGMGDVKKYFSQYVDGVGQLGDGADQLASGVKELDKNSDALNKGAQSMESGLKQLKEAMGNASDSLSAMSSFLSGAASYAAALQKASASVKAIDLSGAEEQANAKAKEQVEKAVKSALSDTDLSDDEKQAIIAAAVDAIDVGDITADAQKEVDAAESAMEAVPSMNMSGSSMDTFSLSSVTSAVDQLYKGSASLTEGLKAYTKGVGQLADGADALSDGIGQLESSGDKLTDGLDELIDGVDEFSDGLQEFDEDGIQELGKYAGKDLEKLVDRVRVLRKLDKAYDNFSGLKDGDTGSVRFLIETDAIEK